MHAFSPLISKSQSSPSHLSVSSPPVSVHSLDLEQLARIIFALTTISLRYRRNRPLTSRRIKSCTASESALRRAGGHTVHHQNSCGALSRYSFQMTSRAGARTQEQLHVQAILTLKHGPSLRCVVLRIALRRLLCYVASSDDDKYLIFCPAILRILFPRAAVPIILRRKSADGFTKCVSDVIWMCRMSMYILLRPNRDKVMGYNSVAVCCS